MIVLAIIAIVVAALLLLLHFVTTTTKKATTAVGLERSRFNNSRGNFVLSIIAGYFLAAIVAMAGFVIAEGIGAFSVGIFVLIASPIYAIPVLIIAATAGYPVYRYCRKDSESFPTIWFAYSAAALTSALCTALLASIAIYQSLEILPGMTAFMVTTSLLVALTSALLTWVRQRSH